MAHEPPARLVTLTGGPGAGKTAVLEAVKQHFCEHVAVLPESASLLFGGGFPRDATASGQRHAQRAIYFVQHELEDAARESGRAAVVLCDRGTLDGAAYWPGSPESFFSDVGTTQSAELSRYAAVIHLCVPPPGAYNRHNPVRIEAAEEAAAIDARIASLWRTHPRFVEVGSSDRFLDKLEATIGLIRSELPTCCRGHRIDGQRRGAQA
jgi:predicted ATPase